MTVEYLNANNDVIRYLNVEIAELNHNPENGAS